ncbi:hypothetical protein CHS0354_037153 [Potamilus streckersoni]|uniref:3'-5' exonuclease domain-containing protein n=1 Tax=Potamilus streckersoni TaxID=2493646 RepID=A0AAE0RP26_9BIVA|nr:hypothetical protein CHS0354_037153 [Potamilus streckersoni]
MHSIDAYNNKITLESVKVCDSKRTLPGLQNFFCHEIENIEVLEETKQQISGKGKKKSPEIQANTKGSRLMGTKYLPSHLERLQIFENKEVLFKDILDKNEDEKENMADTTMRRKDNSMEPQTEWFTVLDQMSDLFKEAIAYVKKHKVIGVALEGVEIGRNGKLLWLQIGLPDHVFLFDVLTLGKDCFDEGLKDILENGNILKVLHNCRFPSDLLFHQYDIKLVNIFDTQATDVFVYRTRKSSWPRHVQGLPACLMHHLNLQCQDVHFMTVRENSRKDDEEVWSRRPAPQQLLEAAAKNVMYLLELRNVLLEKMLEEFVAGVDIYLSQVRDASIEDAKKYQGMVHLLPIAFQDIKEFMATYHGPVKRVSEHNGFSENITGVTNPNIVFSRHSFWHTGFKMGKGRGVLARDSQEDFPIPGNKISPCDAGKLDTKTGSPINLTPKNYQMVNSTPKNSTFTGPSPDKDELGNSVPKTAFTYPLPFDSSDDKGKSGTYDSGSGEKLIEGLSGTSLIRAIMQQQKSYLSPVPSIGKRLEDYNLMPAGAILPKTTKTSDKKKLENNSKKVHFEQNQGKAEGLCKAGKNNLHSRREEANEGFWNPSDENDLSVYLASKNHRDSCVSQRLSDGQKVPGPAVIEKWSDQSTSLSLFNQGQHGISNDISDMKWNIPQNRTALVSHIEGQIGSNMVPKVLKMHSGDAEQRFSVEKASDSNFCKEGFSQKFQHQTSPNSFLSQHSTTSTGSYSQDQNLRQVDSDIRPMSARFKQLEELIRSQKQSAVNIMHCSF